MERVRRWAMAAAAVAALFAAGAAEAHWRGGGYVGVAPPPYSPYPSYRRYDAPSVYHAPPAATEGCYAGAYVCPLDGPAAIGMPCSCPTGRGQAWGRAR